MILHLHLKRCFFDQIKDGSKPFEYRLADKWEKRISGKPWTEIHLYLGYPETGDESRTLRRKWKGFQVITKQHEHFGPKPVKVLAIDVTEPINT